MDSKLIDLVEDAFREFYPVKSERCISRHDIKDWLERQWAEYLNHARLQFFCNECGASFSDLNRFLTHCSEPHQKHNEDTVY